MERISVTREHRDMGRALRHDLDAWNGQADTIPAWTIIAPLDYPVVSQAFRAIIIDGPRAGEVVVVGTYDAEVAFGTIER